MHMHVYVYVRSYDGHIMDSFSIVRFVYSRATTKKCGIIKRVLQLIATGARQSPSRSRTLSLLNTQAYMYVYKGT